MTTNIIRGHLIEYTIQQCLLWGMPLRDNSPSGFYWNAGNRTWESGFVNNLYVAGRRILLVPKSAVSYCKRYAPDKFHRHFLLTFLQNEHLRLGTNLVQTRVKRGKVVRRFVTKRSLVERGGAAFDKDYLATFTLAHPEVFADFREAARTKETSIPIEAFLAEDVQSICQHLEQKLIATATGSDGATTYHRLVVGILDFLLYPQLTKPVIEQEIHEGRKRIDVIFDNGATEGFFATVANQARIPCPWVFVECKNYADDVRNPEIDQLSGRFSMNRGQLGLLLCRKVKDMGLLQERCRDTFRDGRGLIVPLVDDDLIAGLKARAEGVELPLDARFNEIYRSIGLN